MRLLTLLSFLQLAEIDVCELKDALRSLSTYPMLIVDVSNEYMAIFPFIAMLVSFDISKMQI